MDIKIKTLEEQNESLKYQVLELKNKIKSNNNDILIEEIKKQNAALNDESSYLKLQIQLKNSENVRLNKIYKENINIIKRKIKFIKSKIKRSINE